MATLTISFVNDSLKKLGAKEILVKSVGFYYFTGGDSENWKENIVKVSYLNALTLEEWIECYKSFSGVK